MAKVSKKAAKTKSTKVAKPEATPQARRRGGRRPGKWTLVQPSEIVAYRKQNKLSRLSFAKLLGVSSTTVTNWESSRGPAMPLMQEKIAALLRSKPASVTNTTSKRAPVTAAAVPTNGAYPQGYDSVVEGTAKIVAAFVATANLKREELGAVVREVRAALG